MGRSHLDHPRLGRSHLGHPHLGRSHLGHPDLGHPAYNDYLIMKKEMEV